jgi:hypothetical protein
MDVVFGLLIVAILWAFIRVTVRDPGPMGHGSAGGHAGDGEGGGDGGG